MGIMSSIYNSDFNIEQLFLGSEEITEMYLGNQLVFSKITNNLFYKLHEFVGSLTVRNTVEAPVKSAILHGSTKYRDIDTGDILDEFDETKNLELISCKMPVLTTTGKNLVDGTAGDYVGLVGADGETGSQVFVSDGTLKRYSHIVRCKPNTTYTLTTSGSANRRTIGEFNEYPKVGLVGTKWGVYNTSGTLTITTKPSTIYLVCYSYYSSKAHSQSEMDEIVRGLVVQLEESSTATTYEPYKSNILTVNEDVELRGIGDVQDELNLLTGEVIASIVELTVDSNTNIKGERFPVGGVNFVNTSRYAINIKATFGVDVTNGYGLSDKIPYMSTDEDTFHFKVGNYTNYCFIYVPISELETDDWGGFVKWAKNKNFKLLLKRSEKSVKTVDLSSNTVYAYNGTTHYTCSSEEDWLLPTVCIEVPIEEVK